MSSEAPTPVESRQAAVDEAPAGFVYPGGSRALKTALRGNAAEFARWRRDPMTRAVVAALREATVHVPPAVNSNDALVQYGVTQGLAYAFHLCVDPSVLWPGVFGETSQDIGQVPDMDFETSLDEVFQ